MLATSGSDWWFSNLDDKLVAYIFAASAGFNPPKVYFCTTSPSGLLDFTPSAGQGIVVRAANLHSNMGIFVLPEGFGGVELLQSKTMTKSQIIAELEAEGATSVLVEEFVPGPSGNLPMEFKFHVFDGEIGSINIFYGRGTDCGCWAEIDENSQRLDQYG